MINININDISNKVRTTLLTGLNVALTGAITATDTVLEAFGKLQNQITSISNQIGNFVTINTTQTITAQKTFQTSNNSPTIIATHTSGSGAVLQVNKDGNGEGIVINKNSGSGEALELNGGSSVHNSETASTLAHFDSNKVLKSVPAITANRALVSDANGIPTASSVTDTTLGYLDATSSVQTQLNQALKFRTLGIITVPSSHTGSGANTILGSIYIPAGTLVAGDMFNVYSRSFRTNANGTITVRFYLSTSPTSISGATVLGVMPMITTQFTAPITRKLFVVDNTTVAVFATGASVIANDENVSSVASQNETIPTLANDTYLVFTGQLANASDVVTLQSAISNRFRA